MPQKQSQSNKLYSLLAMTGSMTFFLLSPIFVLLILGSWVDKLFKISPFGLIAGAFLGLVIGMISILFFLKKLSNN